MTSMGLDGICPSLFNSQSSYYYISKELPECSRSNPGYQSKRRSASIRRENSGLGSSIITPPRHYVSLFIISFFCLARAFVDMQWLDHISLTSCVESISDLCISFPDLFLSKPKVTVIF